MVSTPDSPLDHPSGVDASATAAPAVDPTAGPTVDPTAERTPVSASAWERAEHLWAAGGALPWLHQEVARRMAERLAVIRMKPQVVLEWDALAGQSRGVLQLAYPAARWVPVAPSALSLHRLQALSRPALPAAAATTLRNPSDASLRGRLVAQWRRWWGNSATGEMPEAPAAQASGSSARGPSFGFLAEAVPPAGAQLLWSNLGLHTHAQPRPLLQRWHQALAVDGFLMFSTFGPDTLRELRSLWEEAGWGPASQPFRDMHDWGDDLVAAGFADPVMDQETLTLTWADPKAALAELRTLGRNAHVARYPGCRTPRWRAGLEETLQRRAGPDGRISLTFEIIYGHAFRPMPRTRLEPLSTVSLDDMRRMVQTARRSV